MDGKAFIDAGLSHRFDIRVCRFRSIELVATTLEKVIVGLRHGRYVCNRYLPVFRYDSGPADVQG